MGEHVPEPKQLNVSTMLAQRPEQRTYHIGYDRIENDILNSKQFLRPHLRVSLELRPGEPCRHPRKPRQQVDEEPPGVVISPKICAPRSAMAMYLLFSSTTSMPYTVSITAPPTVLRMPD